MILAMDANFKLSNRARKGKTNDPPLQPGSAYVISPDEVHPYVMQYVDEKEVCTSARLLRVA
jgi:hypothetical protein